MGIFDWLFGGKKTTPPSTKTYFDTGELESTVNFVDGIKQ